MRKVLVLCSMVLLSCSGLIGQTVINTSFEASPASPAYTVGNINSQNGFAVSSGSAVITTDSAHTGNQSLFLSASSGSLVTEFEAYSGTQPGISNDVYADMWVNPIAYTTKGLAINGYDQFGGSSKRIFVIEFKTNNEVHAYHGSSTRKVGNWSSNTWMRISVKVDFTAEKYKVAINSVADTNEFNFRESYTPTASGTRLANIKEFHSLRFNHTSNNQSATTQTYVDDLYIGTNPIAGVSFGAVSTNRIITVIQPQFGAITLNPVKPIYVQGDTVTATLSIPTGYKNLGWTNDLSGTQLSQAFVVNGNMTIGANVGIDSLNPPPLHTVTVNQPTNGTITLSPAPVNGQYYKETKVTATISHPNCYQFNNWTGDLSGSSLSQQFTVMANMTIGASVISNNTPPTTHVVNTVSGFKTAVQNMNPGDSIIVDDGTYSLGGVTMKRSGCQNKPIVIMAKNQGMAILDGNTSLRLEDVDYITIRGFGIQSANISTGIKMENCRRIKITHNTFALSENSSCNWIYIGDTWGSTAPLVSGNHLIEYNEFTGKTHPGKYITIDGNATQQSQHDTIRFNLFKNNGPRADNEKESIRVGYSGISKSSGHTVIMHNLFEDCDGDPEVVSIKSCDNIIKYNTFKSCLGTLSLRHGDRNLVEGNYFFGEGKTAQFTNSSNVTSTIGCGGIRVYGKDHKIVNNYFEGLTGSRWDAALTITNGDVTNTSGSLSSHYLPENVVIAFNTLVNNASNIEIGFDNNGNYSKAPKNCVLANNIVVEDSTSIVKSYSATSLAGVGFTGNMFYPTGTSTVGITHTTTQITVADPGLIKPTCVGAGCNQTTAARVFRLEAGSAAVDASTGNYPEAALDLEGFLRAGTKDIGAHEYSGGRTVSITALSAANVGPNAVPLSYTYTYPGNTGIDDWRRKSAGIELYPNPAHGMIHIALSTEPEVNSEWVVINSLGAVVLKEVASRDKRQHLQIEGLAPGIYHLQLRSGIGAQFNKSFIVQ